jgi:hypothetical protein
MDTETRLAKLERQVRRQRAAWIGLLAVGAGVALTGQASPRELTVDRLTVGTTGARTVITPSLITVQQGQRAVVISSGDADRHVAGLALMDEAGAVRLTMEALPTGGGHLTLFDVAGRAQWTTLGQ